MPSCSWRTWSVATAVAVAVALALAGPDGLAAQERGGEADWWRWALAEVLAGQEIVTTEGRRVTIGPRARSGRQERERDRRRFRGERDSGIPAFCRTGEGHPVFGRDWCIEKGFGLGGGWSRGDLGEIIFRRAPRRDGAILDRPGIEEILGDIILGRMLEHAPTGRGGAPLTGRWLELDDPDARVLQLRSGSRPWAELSDLDRDGVVDVVLWSEAEPPDDL